MVNLKFSIFRHFGALVCIAVALWTHEPVASTLSEFEIVVDKPTFVLPQFTGPFRQREASIAPEEYETAERWRTMLDNNQRDVVLQELEGFYDIELSPAMMTLKAQIYFSLKMYDKAEATFLKVLERMPQLVRVHSDLGQLYLIREEYKKARHHFASAVSFGSNEAIIHGQLAYLNLTLHGATSAITEYQQAMALEPENPQWQRGLLAAYSQAKMYDAAGTLLTELLASKPGESDLWLNQATLALQMEDYERALASLEMAILLGDNDERNLRTAAQLHLQLHSYDRALQLLDEVMSSGPLNMKAINEYLLWLSQLNMWDQARKLLDNASGAVTGFNSQEQSLYFLHRARIENAESKYGQAETYFKRALEKNPASGNALLSYAHFSAERKNFVEAELLYIRAEGIAEVEKKALLGRAQLYIDMQDYESALKHLNIAYQKFPDMVELRTNIEILENIIRAKEKAQSS